MNLSPTLALFGAILLIACELAALAKMRNVLHAMLFATFAECGYVLMGLGLHTASGWAGASMHLVYQLVMRGLVFLSLGILIRKAKSSDLDRLAGSWQREPLVSLAFGFGVFSVMGLSPFKGSFSKFLILYAAVENGHWMLAAVGTMASMIAAAYNVHFIQRICFERVNSTEQASWKPTWSTSQIWVLALTALTIQMSLFPRPLLHLATAFASKCAGIVPEYESPWSFLVLLPYVGAFAIFALGLVSARLRNFGAILLAGGSFVVVWRQTTLDSISWLSAVVFAGICFVVVLYSTSYITDKVSNRYFFLLFLMLGSLLGVATERQFGNFYVFWELMTWTSYLLVIHEQTKDALRAGLKYFLMCTSGAYVMHLGILILHSRLQTFDMTLIAKSASHLSPGVAIAVASLFTIGFAVKAGLFPLHSWLPSAHPVAPSSISAPMSGIVTKAGVFGIVKVLFLILGTSTLWHSYLGGWSSPLTFFLSVAGVVTLLYGEAMAYRQTQLKRMLAYSTLAQVGEIVAVLGLGTYSGVAASMYHVINHAIMKTLLFLAAGALLFRTHKYSIAELKGVGRQLPLTAICFSIAALSISGLPPFCGFFSKFALIYASVQSGHIGLAAMMLLGGVIAAIYYSRIICLLFFEKYEGPPLKAVPLAMQVSIVMLTALVLLGGIFPGYALGYAKSVADLVASSSGLRVDAIPSLQVLWPACAIIASIGAVLAYLAGKRSPTAAGIVAVASMAIALASILIHASRFALLSYWFAALIAAVGCVNLLYSIGYLRHSHAHSRYYFLFVSMIGGLLGMVASRDLLSFFAFWEIMSSWTLYFLIIHEETPSAVREGTKYFVFNVIGASFMFLGIVMLGTRAGSFRLDALALSAGSMPSVWIASAVISIVAGMLMKAAVLPVRIDVQMHPPTAPTPVSGYISAVLLKSGVFGVLKLISLFGGALLLCRLGRVTGINTLQYVIAIVAAATMLYAGAMAVVQNGIKRLLIYSTVSQIGYMLLGISLGSAMGVAGGLMHLVNHMLLKNTLFLCAGCILAQAHVHSLDELGGLAKRMPFTFTCFLFAGLSISGVPPFNGFSSKWMIYEAALQSNHYFLAMAALISSLFTLAAILKFAHAAFMGQPSAASASIQEAPLSMLIPIGALSLASVLISIMPGILLVPIMNIQQSLGLPAINATWAGALPGATPWSPGTMIILLALLGISMWTYLRICNRTVVRTRLYMSGAVDFDLRQARLGAANLYEQPDRLVRGALRVDEEEEQHA